MGGGGMLREFGKIAVLKDRGARRRKGAVRAREGDFGIVPSFDGSAIFRRASTGQSRLVLHR
jgi:hypothetical protein